MSKQDRQGVRTPADLEMKYNFGKSFAEVMGIANGARIAADEALNAIDKFNNNLDSETIFNLLTENGALQGLYREDGQLYVNASYIKSGKISTVYSKVFFVADYTNDDLSTMQNIMVGNITPTAEQMEKYDIDGNGVLSASDFTIIRNMLLSGKDTTVSWKFILNPSDEKEVLKVSREIERPISDGELATKETVMLCVGANEGVAPATEDEAEPGCYYRVIDKVQEWINPPMNLNVEYCTTERWNRKRVYTKLVNYGGIPNTNRYAVAHRADATQILRCVGTNMVNGTCIPCDTVSVFADLTNITMVTTADHSGQTAYVQIWYTKD